MVLAETVNHPIFVESRLWRSGSESTFCPAHQSFARIAAKVRYRSEMLGIWVGIAWHDLPTRFRKSASRVTFAGHSTALARGSPNPFPPELSSPPRPGGRGRGLAGDELDAPSTQRRDVRRPVGRSGAAKATVTRMGRDLPPDRTMRRAARWLGTRRRAALPRAQGRIGGKARGAGRSPAGA